jgi:hypothetical protein
MITSRPLSRTASENLSGPQAPSAQIDWFRFAAIPAATWLTHVMATQKVFEAVRRQAVLTTDMLGPASSTASAERPDTFAGHPNSGSPF